MAQPCDTRVSVFNHAIVNEAFAAMAPRRLFESRSVCPCVLAIEHAPSTELSDDARG